MRFAIYGAGGLGGYYGARLAQAGHEVSFVARGAHLEAMERNGLVVRSPAGDVHIEHPVASDDPAALGEVDMVLVAVKTWQIPEVAAAMSPLLGPETVVVPFLNGVEAADQLAEHIGGERVLGGLAKIFSLIESPGVIRHLGTGAILEIGELDGSESERVKVLCEVFTAAGLDIVASEDVRRALWRKLLMVGTWSGLGALARSPIGVMRSDPATRTLIDRGIDEGVAVAGALGHDPGPTVRDDLWSFYEMLPPDTTTSMQRDLMAGRPSELEAWDGAFVRFGARAGVPTPIHDFAYQLLAPMERRARGEPEPG